jgi:hypothetical protein
MNGGAAWAQGDAVVYREILNGRVWTARPVTVIQDTPALVALHLAHGAKWQRFMPRKPGAPPLHCKAARCSWHLAEAVWEFGDTVLLCNGGEAHATHVMWNPAREFIGWYVNLQEPLRRTRVGFETLDQELDIVVEPSGRWRWKDVEHLAEAEALGVFTPAQCRAVRAEAQRVIARIEARAAPFDGSWADWQPPRDWPNPGLPDGWERLA